MIIAVTLNDLRTSENLLILDSEINCTKMAEQKKLIFWSWGAIFGPSAMLTLRYRSGSPKIRILPP